MSDENLYHDLIISRNKQPRYFSQAGQGVEVEAYNPVCGDEFKIKVQLVNDLVKDISFSGYGCAVSKAAIDLLIEEIVGTKRPEALSILNYYLQVLKMQDPPDENDYPLAVFQRVKNHPARWECATLGATALITFLEKK